MKNEKDTMKIFFEYLYLKIKVTGYFLRQQLPYVDISFCKPKPKIGIDAYNVSYKGKKYFFLRFLLIIGYIELSMRVD